MNVRPVPFVRYFSPNAKEWKKENIVEETNIFQENFIGRTQWRGFTLALCRWIFMRVTARGWRMVWSNIDFFLEFPLKNGLYLVREMHAIRWNACRFWRDWDLFCVKDVGIEGVESLQHKVWVRIVSSTLWVLRIERGAPGSQRLRRSPGDDLMNIEWIHTINWSFQIQNSNLVQVDAKDFR